MNEPGVRARALASRLLIGLTCLSRAVSDGGAVSELHLLSLFEDTAALLDELGGFDDVLGPYR